MLTIEQLIACGLEKAEALQITEAVNRMLAKQSPDSLLCPKFHATSSHHNTL